jgi:hypothetical protein
MKYIIQKTDDENTKTYFSVGTTRWTTDKSQAKQFEFEHTAKYMALSLNTYYELEVIEYEQ